MARGQAEHLFPFVEAQMSMASVTWQDVDLIAVGIGPGNFTGTRISVSAARGLALSLSRHAIGVSSFEWARNPEDGLAAHPAEIVSVAAPRDRAYIQPFRYGRPTGDPEIIDPENPPVALARPNLRFVGHRARELAGAFDADFAEARTFNVAERIARIAEWRVEALREAPSRPAPLYVRPADAAPPSDPAPVIVP